MKLINPKFAAAACLFGMLAAPAAVFAGYPAAALPTSPRPTPISARVPEPSTLAMILVGAGFVIGLTVVEIRRNRRRSVVA
jgi:hypothetical protein